MTTVCRKTCGFCSEEEGEEKEDEEKQSEGENEEDEKDEDKDKMETTWTKISGQRVKGKKLAADMELEAAKKKCCSLGDKCAGISCKGSRKCALMADISNQTDNEKYNVFVKNSAL
jgi:hypothetical protein